MLDRGGDDVIAAIAVGEADPLEGQIICFRAPAGKDDPPRSGVDELSDLAPRGLNGLLGVAAGRVNARGVSMFGFKIREHRLAHCVCHRSGGVVVQIDSTFVLRPRFRRFRNRRQARPFSLSGGLPCRLRSLLDLHDLTEEGFVDREACDVIVITDIGQLVDVPLPPCFRPNGCAAAHTAFDRAPEDVVGHARPERNCATRGAHVDQVSRLDSSLLRVGEIEIHRGFRLVLHQTLDAVVLGPEVRVRSGA